MRCSKETAGCIHGSCITAGFRSGQGSAVRQGRGGKTNSSSHIYKDQMYGQCSHLGLAAEKVDARVFGKNSLPPSPPRLHLCEGGDGNYTECNICTGEMAERLLQIYVIVNKSSICPNDKSLSKGRARGHQMRVTSCNCCCHPRRGATCLQQDGGQGRLGDAKISHYSFQVIAHLCLQQHSVHPSF